MFQDNIKNHIKECNIYLVLKVSNTRFIVIYNFY